MHGCTHAYMSSCVQAENWGQLEQDVVERVEQARMHLACGTRMDDLSTVSATVRTVGAIVSATVIATSQWRQVSPVLVAVVVVQTAGTDSCHCHCH